MSEAPGKTTFATLADRKARREPIVMVTAYDHPGARVADAAGVDVVLVGDSAAMTVLGYDSTVPITVEEMIILTAAVRRGLTTPLLVADLPAGSYEGSDEQAVATARRFADATGCDAVKIEGGGPIVDRARAIVAAGIRVVGHVGLTPQTALDFKAQGRTAEAAREIIDEALALQDGGCSAIVLEAIPSDVTEALMPRMDIPVVGIGAGPGTDGQVLVFHDLLGLSGGRPARFVKRYADLLPEMIGGVAAFADDVRSRRYPGPEHGYAMAPGESERLRSLL